MLLLFRPMGGLRRVGIWGIGERDVGCGGVVSASMACDFGHALPFLFCSILFLCWCTSDGCLLISRVANSLPWLKESCGAVHNYSLRAIVCLGLDCDPEALFEHGDHDMISVPVSATRCRPCSPDGTYLNEPCSYISLIVAQFMHLWLSHWWQITCYNFGCAVGQIYGYCRWYRRYGRKPPSRWRCPGGVETTSKLRRPGARTLPTLLTRGLSVLMRSTIT